MSRSAFCDAAGGAPGDVFPGRGRVLGGVARLPLVEGPEDEPRLAAEPGGHRLGIAAERHRLRRDGVEGLADRGAPVGDRLHEHLGDVVGMDVMHRLEPEIRQGQFLAAGKRGEGRQG